MKLLLFSSCEFSHYTLQCSIYPLYVRMFICCNDLLYISRFIIMACVCSLLIICFHMSTYYAWVEIDVLCDVGQDTRTVRLLL